MTKSQNPFELKTGGGLLKKVLGVLITLAVLSLIIKFPGEVATTVKHTGQAAVALINGFGTFLHVLLG